METIKRHVDGMLRNCLIEKGWPVYSSYHQRFDSLSTEVIKSKGEWVDNNDVFNIFILAVNDILSDKYASLNNVSGALNEILDDKELSEFSDYLSNFYCSIPITYDIYFRLPSGSTTLPSVVIGPELSLVNFSKGDEIPWGMDIRQGGLLSLADPARFSKPTTYLKSTATGYFSNSCKNKTARQALTVFKIVLFQLINSDLITISTKRPAALGLYGALTHHSIEKHHIECIEKNTENFRHTSVELSIDLSLFLSQFDINLLPSSPIVNANKSEAAPILLGILRLAEKIAKNSSDGAKRVKSAIEWFIDSHTSENTTISFLQICIALEAIFGDDNGGDSLTKTLGDRCAYLIGSSIDDRKKIRDRFEKLYKVRSKLVHGVIAALSQDEQQHLAWGRVIAQHSIQKEMLNLRI